MFSKETLDIPLALDSQLPYSKLKNVGRVILAIHRVLGVGWQHQA